LISLLSSEVSTPFTMIGNEVIVWSHFTSCYKICHSIYCDLWHPYSISRIRKSYTWKFYIL